MASKSFTLSPNAEKVFENANDVANRYGFKSIGSEHLLIGLIMGPNGDPVADSILHFYANTSKKPLFATPNEIIHKITKTFPALAASLCHGTGKLPLNPEAQRILEMAHGEAKVHNDGYIDTNYLLSGMTDYSDSSAKTFLVFLVNDLVGLGKMVEEKRKARARVQANEPRTTAPVNVADLLSTKAASIINAATNAAMNVTEAVSERIRNASPVITETSNHLADAIKNSAKSRKNTVITRDEWIALLDKAIELSEKTGNSVQSCFIELVFQAQSRMNQEAVDQRRKDTVQDIIDLFSKYQNSDKKINA